MKAHGDHHIKVIENIVQITYIGAFNEQGVRLALAALRKTIDNLNGNHFLLLSDYQEVEGATVEAYNEIRINNEWLARQNIIAKAITFSSETVKNIGFKHVPQQGLNSKVFNNTDEAMHWLKQQAVE